MAKPTVIFDPVMEMAALVDTDTMRALGPTMVGPAAGAMLGEFVDNIPEPFFSVGGDMLMGAWLAYYAEHFSGAEATPQPVDQHAAIPEHDPAHGLDPVATTAQGAPTDEPPAAAPADTDVEAGTGETDQVTTPTTGNGDVAPAAPVATVSTTQPCPACSATGMVTITDGEPQQVCNMCAGSGKITVTVAA